MPTRITSGVWCEKHKATMLEPKWTLGERNY